MGSPAVGRALLPSGPSEGVVVDVADGVAELDVAKGVGVAEGDDDDIDDKLDGNGNTGCWVFKGGMQN